MIIVSAPVGGADRVHAVGAADAVTRISESDPLGVVRIWKHEGASWGGKQELKLRCAQQRPDLRAGRLFNKPARKCLGGRERLTKGGRKRVACGDHARDKQGPAEWAGKRAVSGEHRGLTYLQSYIDWAHCQFRRNLNHKWGNTWARRRLALKPGERYRAMKKKIGG